MPAGSALANTIAGLLHVQIGKTMKDIGLELRPPRTARAVRYAVSMLIAEGRARRVGNPYCRVKIFAMVQEAEPCHGPEDTTCPSCGFGSSPVASQDGGRP